MKAWFRFSVLLPALIAVYALILPHCLAAQTLLVGDHGSQAIGQYDLGSGSPPLTIASVPTPYDIIVGPNNTILVATGEVGSSIERFDGTTGAWLGTFVAPGSGGMGIPYGLAYGPDGNLYVSNYVTGSILRFNGTTGAFLGTFVANGSGGLSSPGGLVFGPDNNLYVVNPYSNAILRFNGTTGAPMGVFAAGNGLAFPRTLTFGPDHNLYVGNGFFNGVGGVLRFDGATGAFIDNFVPNHSGGLDTTADLTFGTDGRLYVVSEGTRSILCYNSVTGAFLGTIGTTRGNPYGILFRAGVLQPPIPVPISITANPTSVTGGASVTATVFLSGTAPTGGATLTIASNNSHVSGASAFTIPAGASQGSFTLTTTSVAADATVTLKATYNKVTVSTQLLLKAPVVAGLTLNPSTIYESVQFTPGKKPTPIPIREGLPTSIATVTLTGNAPAGGTLVTLQSSRTSVAQVPTTVTVPAGARSATFVVSVSLVTSPQASVITAATGTTSKSATLTVIP